LRRARLESSHSRLQPQRLDQERQADPTISIRLAREKDGEDRLFGLAQTLPLGRAARRAEAERAWAETRLANAQEVQSLRETRADLRVAWRKGPIRPGRRARKRPGPWSRPPICRRGPTH